MFICLFVCFFVLLLNVHGHCVHTEQTNRRASRMQQQQHRAKGENSSLYHLLFILLSHTCTPSLCNFSTHSRPTKYIIISYSLSTNMSLTCVCMCAFCIEVFLFSIFFSLFSFAQYLLHFIELLLSRMSNQSLVRAFFSQSHNLSTHFGCVDVNSFGSFLMYLFGGKNASAMNYNCMWIAIVSIRTHIQNPNDICSAFYSILLRERLLIAIEFYALRSIFLPKILII